MILSCSYASLKVVTYQTLRDFLRSPNVHVMSAESLEQNLHNVAAPVYPEAGVFQGVEMPGISLDHGLESFHRQQLGDFRR